MIKKKDESNGTLDALARAVKDIQQQLEYLHEKQDKKDSTGEAKLFMAQQVYNTPREKLGEFSRISLRMVDPFSLADAAHSILDEDVQIGLVSLGQKRRESLLRYMRSVGTNNLLEKGTTHALEQTRSEEIEGEGEEARLGKGL